MKKISAILTSIASACLMVFSSVPVMAAASDVIDNSKTGSITIHKYDTTAATQAGVNTSSYESTGKTNTEAEKALEKYAIKGVEFTYLRVGDVEQMSDNGKVKLIYEIPDALQAILDLKTTDAAKTTGGKTYFTAQQINDNLATALTDNTKTKDKLENYIKTDGTAFATTDANGLTSKDNLDLGLYLIVETRVPEDVVDTTNPYFVQLPMTDSDGEDWFYDVECYPKNQTGIPTLKKKVRNNPNTSNVTTSSADSLTDFTKARTEYTYADTVTASEGETLDYELVSKMPHITSSTTYLKTYTFKDTLNKGITYGKDTVIAIYDSEDAAKNTNKNNVDTSGALTVWKSGDATKMFNAEYGTDGDNTTMTISMTTNGLNEINKKYSDKYIVVYYTANVKSSDVVTMGDKGNPNDVSLTWKRTNEEHYDILKDECIVYTFGLDVTKKFSDNKGDATKVKFVAQNTSDKYFLKATGSNGVYYVTGKSAEEDEATQFSPAADGSLKINGVEADTYEITETHSDAGYSLLKKPVVVTINTTTANITPTEANITGIQSKPGNDATANDGNVNGTELKSDVIVETTAATASIDENTITMAAAGESANGIVPMEITNQKGFLLPLTGGKGIYFLTILGVLVFAAGMYLLNRKKKTQ